SAGQLLPDRPDHRRQGQRREGRCPGREGISLVRPDPERRLPLRVARRSAGGRGTMVHRSDRASAGAGNPRSVVWGEAFRRFMLRPESTALAAVIILFIIFTILSPQLFPTKLTYISIMAVASELGILSIGVTLLMIGGHFDLSIGAV